MKYTTTLVEKLHKGL